MCRLTSKIGDSYHVGNASIAIKKLGRLEDIEGSLGIDIISLFRAFDDGVLYYGEYGVENDKVKPIHYDVAEICHEGIQAYDPSKPDYFIGFRYYLRFDDYGKTWKIAERNLNEG